MDVWIAVFAVLAAVCVVAGYVVGNSLRPRKKARSSGIPSRTTYDFNVPVASIRDEAGKGSAPWDESPEEGYESPSVKGFKIAWKQFSSELDTFVSDVSGASCITGYHKQKYDELSSFFSSAQSTYPDIINDVELVAVREKLAKAKQMLNAY